MQSVAYQTSVELERVTKDKSNLKHRYTTSHMLYAGLVAENARGERVDGAAAMPCARWSGLLVRFRSYHNLGFRKP